MQALTKKPHIGNQAGDTVSIYVTIPKKKLDEVKQGLESFGGVINRVYDNSEWVDARQYVDMDSPEFKRSVLRGARYRENLTQKQLSERTGIPIRHISEMENGKRTIGKNNAKKLGESLNTKYQKFL